MMTPTEFLVGAASPNSVLQDAWGTSTTLAARLDLVRRVVARFQGTFGDLPIRLFRAPGRINLRGMHVDTHGGYLNLMAHHRELIVAIAHMNPDVVVDNVDVTVSRAHFSVDSFTDLPEFSGPWTEFIASPRVVAHVVADHTWQKYLQGCVLRLRHAFPSTEFYGVRAVVGSDLPQGAALSSSAALCVAFTRAYASMHGITLSDNDMVRFSRDAEWYAGTRCGCSDQAAIVLARPNALTTVALDQERVDTQGATYTELSPEVSVLVIDSRTKRSLSGASRLAYTQNRFAYSMALGIARQEIERLGIDRGRCAEVKSLPDLSPAAWRDQGGDAFIYAMLQEVPETIRIDELERKYDFPNVHQAYRHYFELVSEEERPTEIPIRGPLVYGIAESERARVFPTAIRERRWRDAGHLMCLGHNGDRLFTREGKPFNASVSDEFLRRMAADGKPVHELEGIYGASSAALDQLVDCAMDHGAFGACLTGAGIAGSVIALVPSDSANEIARAIESSCAAWDVPPQAVINHAVRGVSELSVGPSHA